MPENNRDPKKVNHVYAQDRASRMATAVICTVVDDLRRWLDGELVSLADTRRHATAYLRDEISDIEREVFADRSLPSEGVSDGD